MNFPSAPVIGIPGRPHVGYVGCSHSPVLIALVCCDPDVVIFFCEVHNFRYRALSFYSDACVLNESNDFDRFFVFVYFRPGPLVEQKG